MNHIILAAKHLSRSVLRRSRVNRFLSVALASAAILTASPLSGQKPARAAPPGGWMGAYLGNPNGSDATAEQTFTTAYTSFVKTLHKAPRMIDSFVDYTQPVASWPGNAGWQAWSNAQSVDAKKLLPVVSLPLISTAKGAPTPDAQFQAFASGQYDSAVQGVVEAWAQHGFAHLFIRVGWEMNLQGTPYFVGADAQSQADWVKAFQHVYRVIHLAARAAGVTVRVIWNPGATNYSYAEATTNLYPGDNYVDIVGADIYGGMYPFSDGGASPTYHDWDTGAEDTSVAQFIADPVNRAHYWSYPAATRWSLDGSGGHAQSLLSLLQFAQAHGKPFAIPETGAGNCSDHTDVCDDPTFPQWLQTQLQAAEKNGAVISFVNIWDSNGGGNYEFSKSTDNKPLEAAAWAAFAKIVQ